MKCCASIVYLFKNFYTTFFETFANESHTQKNNQTGECRGLCSFSESRQFCEIQNILYI